MDLADYREFWFQKGPEEIHTEAQKLEKEIVDLKRKYLAKAMNRHMFYENFEQKSLNLAQIKRLLKYHQN